ncbi:acyl-CoA dehydrogenase family protein [bacterium]|nr:acyl-CoA dehydrogenase family protein [bacterium]
MIFELREDQKVILNIVKKFIREEVEPIAEEIDRDERFPIENIAKMGAMRIPGAVVPRKYDGAGLDYQTYVRIVEEFSKTCASTGVIIAGANSLLSFPILTWGTEEQKNKWLPLLSRGELFGVFGLTEPEAGSDASNMKTVAVADGDDYILNGTKHFITGGDIAGMAIIFAGVKKNAKSKRAPMSAFIVETNTPGFSVGRVEDKLGIRGATTAELILEDVRIPKENIIGKVGLGFRIALETLACGRLGVAAQALGIAQGAYDAAISYSMERKQFGKAIFNFQAIQFKLVEMAVKIENARNLIYKSAYNKDNGKPFEKLAAMAKLYASDIASEVADEAIQIHGGFGYMKDYPVERFYRDARITRIYEGTNEIHKMIIANYLQKEI